MGDRYTGKEAGRTVKDESCCLLLAQQSVRLQDVHHLEKDCIDFPVPSHCKLVQGSHGCTWVQGQGWIQICQANAGQQSLVSVPIRNVQDTNRATLYADLDFEQPPWDTLTPEAKELVQSLLQRDPEQRPSAAEALHHRSVKFRATLELKVWSTFARPAFAANAL